MKLDLETQEVDLICQAVQQLPWHMANPLLNKIIHQANNQAMYAGIQPQENQNADGNPGTQSPSDAG